MPYRTALCCCVVLAAIASAARADGPPFTVGFTENAGNWNSIFAQGFSAFVEPNPDPGLGLLDTVSLDRFEFFKSGSDDTAETFRLAIVDNYFLNLQNLTTASPELVALSDNSVDGTAAIAIGAPISFTFSDTELTYAADYAAVYVTESPGGVLEPVLVPSLIADYEETSEGSGVFLPVSAYGDPEFDFQYTASNFVNTDEFGSFFAAFEDGGDARFIAYFNQPASSLPGDANGDGAVDLLDLDILGTNFGLSPADVSQGDFNADNVVDLLDLDILGTNFGSVAGASIPEPGSLSLLCLALLARQRRN